MNFSLWCILSYYFALRNTIDMEGSGLIWRDRVSYGGIGSHMEGSGFIWRDRVSYGGITCQFELAMCKRFPTNNKMQ